MTRNLQESKGKILSFKKKVGTGTSVSVSDYLATHTGLPKTRIKDAMIKGAVWLQRKKDKKYRLRRATTSIQKGDIIELYYDEAVLRRTAPEPEMIRDLVRYSVWYKPPGVLAEGTNYGDHCSMLRQVEQILPGRDIHPVHRLDREVSGLIILAHDKEAAGAFSRLFRDNRIEKRYRAEVVGNPWKKAPRGLITLPLDGKEAVTEFVLERYHPETETSTIMIRLRTGRLHQIRRHFDMIGHPVVGDPKYGKGNKNTEGIKLTAIMLRFHCPVLGEDVSYTMDDMPSRIVKYRA